MEVRRFGGRRKRHQPPTTFTTKNRHTHAHSPRVTNHRTQHRPYRIAAAAHTHTLCSAGVERRASSAGARFYISCIRSPHLDDTPPRRPSPRGAEAAGTPPPNLRTRRTYFQRFTERHDMKIFQHSSFLHILFKTGMKVRRFGGEEEQGTNPHQPTTDNSQLHTHTTDQHDDHHGCVCPGVYGPVAHTSLYRDRGLKRACMFSLVPFRTHIGTGPRGSFRRACGACCCRGRATCTTGRRTCGTARRSTWPRL